MKKHPVKITKAVKLSKKIPSNRLTLLKDIADEYSIYINAKNKKVSSKLFCNIIKDLLEEIIKEMIFNCFKWKLPKRLGQIYISRKKINNLNYRPINWFITKKVNKEREKKGKEKIYVYHDNYHSDGYVYRWFWDKKKTKALFKNKHFYCFVPVRSLTKSLSEAIKTQTICNK